MAYGASGSAAWFTDQESIVNNTVTAGEVDISINTEGSTHPFTVGNLMPGEWTGNYNLGVYNSGSTVPVKYRITSDFVWDSAGGFYNLINVRAAHTFAGTPGNWCATGSGLIKYEGPLYLLDVNSIDDAISDTLGLNITHVWQLCFGLDSTTTNNYQDASATFNIVVDATQATNPGWSE
jgi:predicted ribosomally synthesized peptide with SipW-like signal peptide